MKRNPKTIDWQRLETEWMTSSESLNQFAIRHQISTTYFYEKIAQLEWVEKKQKIREKALEKAAGGAAVDLARQWTVQLNLWKGLERQLNALLARTMDETRTKIIAPLDASQLAALAVMLSCSLKSQKLILGEASEITEERSISAYIAKIVHKIEQEGGDAIGIDLIPPRNGKRV